MHIISRVGIRKWTNLIFMWAEQWLLYLRLNINVIYHSDILKVKAKFNSTTIHKTLHISISFSVNIYCKEDWMVHCFQNWFFFPLQKVKNVMNGKRLPSRIVWKNIWIIHSTQHLIDLKNKIAQLDGYLLDYIN